jgi:hypothetical protein
VEKGLPYLRNIHRHNYLYLTILAIYLLSYRVKGYIHLLAINLGVEMRTNNRQITVSLSLQYGDATDKIGLHPQTLRLSHYPQRLIDTVIKNEGIGLFMYLIDKS